MNFVSISEFFGFKQNLRLDFWEEFYASFWWSKRGDTLFDFGVLTISIPLTGELSIATVLKFFLTIWIGVLALTDPNKGVTIFNTSWVFFSLWPNPVRFLLLGTFAYWKKLCFYILNFAIVGVSLIFGKYCGGFFVAQRFFRANYED